MDYTVRRVKPSDWKNIKKDIMGIEKSVFELCAQETETDLESTLIKDSSMCYVLDHGECVIGYLASFPIEDLLYVESLAIHTDHNNKGLGKKIFTVFLEDALKQYSKIGLHAINEKMVKIALQFGFEKKEYVDKWLGENGAWYMERKC